MAKKLPFKAYEGSAADRKAEKAKPMKEGSKAELARDRAAMKRRGK